MTHMKLYIVAIEPLDGKQVQIYITSDGEVNATVYAVLSVDSHGAGIVDSGYRSVAEAAEAWPEAIGPSPAVHLTPRDADSQAITGTGYARNLTLRHANLENLAASRLQSDVD